MSLTGGHLDAFLAAGLTAEQIVALVKADIEEREKAAAQRRSKDAERQRRHRESRGVTVTDADSQPVTDKGSLEVSPPAPPLPKPSKIAPLSPPKSGKPELPDWMPVEEWAAFKEMRRKMRGIPFTETAERMVMAKLEKLRGEGHDPAKLLSKAVERGHRTVFEDESTRAKSARTAKPMTRDEMANAIRFHRDRGDEDRARQIENELRGPPPQIASVIRGASSALKVGGGHG